MLTQNEVTKQELRELPRQELSTLLEVMETEKRQPLGNCIAHNT